MSVEDNVLHDFNDSPLGFAIRSLLQDSGHTFDLTPATSDMTARKACQGLGATTAPKASMPRLPTAIRGSMCTHILRKFAQYGAASEWQEHGGWTADCAWGQPRKYGKHWSDTSWEGGHGHKYRKKYDNNWNRDNKWKQDQATEKVEKWTVVKWSRDHDGEGEEDRRWTKGGNWKSQSSVKWKSGHDEEDQEEDHPHWQGESDWKSDWPEDDRCIGCDVEDNDDDHDEEFEHKPDEEETDDKKTHRGTKRRGGAREQAKRAVLREKPETAECLALLFRGGANEGDILYLTRVFGRPQVEEFIRLSSDPAAYDTA